MPHTTEALSASLSSLHPHRRPASAAAAAAYLLTYLVVRSFLRSVCLRGLRGALFRARLWFILSLGLAPRPPDGAT